MANLDIEAPGSEADPLFAALSASVPNGLGPTFAIIGDSISAFCTSSAGSDRHYRGKGYATWLRILSRQSVQMPLAWNFGVGSETLAQIDARLDTALAVKPDFLIIQGGVNDVFAGTSFASMQSTMASLILRTIEAGVVPVVMVIHPKGSPGSALTSTQANTLLRFNEWLRELGYGRSDVIAAAALLRGKYPLVCDTWPYLADQTAAGTTRSGSTYDGLHPTDMGGYLAGKALWELLQPFVPIRRTQFSNPGDYYHSTENPTGNLLRSTTTSRGTLAGTTGTITNSTGFTGTGSGTGVAVGWGITKSGGTATTTATGTKESPRTDAPFATGERQRIQAAMSAVGSVRERVRLTAPAVADADISTGDVIFGEIGFDLKSGHSRVLGIQLTLLDSSSNQIGGDCVSVAGDSAYGTLPSVDAIAGLLRTPPITVHSSATSATLLVDIVFDPTSGSPAADVYFSDAAVRKIV